MRLIDADALLQEMKRDKWCEDYLGKDVAEGIYDYIEQSPTAFDKDKVLERLEQQKNQYLRRAKEIESRVGENHESKKNYSKYCSYDYAIEIVKGGGVVD